MVCVCVCVSYSGLVLLGWTSTLGVIMYDDVWSSVNISQLSLSSGASFVA